jgi:hypothetical protein
MSSARVSAPYAGANMEHPDWFRLFLNTRVRLPVRKDAEILRLIPQAVKTA